jgi:hypothetical protein
LVSAVETPKLTKKPAGVSKNSEKIQNSDMGKKNSEKF